MVGITVDKFAVSGNKMNSRFVLGCFVVGRGNGATHCRSGPLTPPHDHPPCAFDLPIREGALHDSYHGTLRAFVTPRHFPSNLDALSTFAQQSIAVA